MQSIPLAVLKLIQRSSKKDFHKLHAIHTACGIETNMMKCLKTSFQNCMQSIPLAVLKLSSCCLLLLRNFYCMQSIPLAVLKHDDFHLRRQSLPHCMQSIPLAVLKLNGFGFFLVDRGHCMQSIPLAVLKRLSLHGTHASFELHAIHTACGIETDGPLRDFRWRSIACNPYRLRY